MKKSGDRSDPRQPDRPLVDPGVFPQLILQPCLVRGVRPSYVEAYVPPVEAEDVAEDEVAEDVAESRTVRYGVQAHRQCRTPDTRDTPVGPI